MFQEYWMNSPLSLARFYGKCETFGHEYWIVNKDGLDLFALSAIMPGNKAIEPGEPADLVRKDFLPFYRQLKRERFLEILRAYKHMSDKDLKQIYKEACKEKKEKKKMKEKELF